MIRSSHSRRRRLPSPALVVSCIALAVALSGVGYAAVALPPKSVGTKHLKDNAVTAKKVKNGTLVKADHAPGVIPAGARILMTTSTPAVALTAVAPEVEVVQTLALPAGTFFVEADVIVLNNSDAGIARPRCFLRGSETPTGGGFNGLIQPLAPNGGSDVWRLVIPLAGSVRLSAPGEVRVDCNKAAVGEDATAIATLRATRMQG